MTKFTRRDFVKTVAAASALPLIGASAQAAEPFKVAFIFDEEESAPSHATVLGGGELDRAHGTGTAIYNSSCSTVSVDCEYAGSVDIATSDIACGRNHTIGIEILT